MMPRYTPARVFVLLIFVPVTIWVLLAAVYACLPSPSYSWSNEPSRFLATGNKVTRVYRYVEPELPQT
jgi:hypothetical protein